jgi:hemerythrin-like domain-containing protein
MPSDLFRDHHARIRYLADELTQQIGPETAENAAAIRDLLSRMTGVLAVHLAAEDHTLYPRLLSDSRADVSAMAKKFKREMGGLKKSFLDYAKRWSRDAIQEHAYSFAQETNRIIPALVARFAHEESDFYPMVGV